MGSGDPRPAQGDASRAKGPGRDLRHVTRQPEGWYLREGDPGLERRELERQKCVHGGSATSGFWIETWDALAE